MWTVYQVNGSRSRHRTQALGTKGRCASTTLTENGSPGRIRTRDNPVNGRMLYQLSYKGMVVCVTRLERVTPRFQTEYSTD